jgi:hypothetical protein
MSDWYVLDDKHNPVKVDLMTGAKALEDNRRVDETMIGESRISTIFMGLNHAFGGGPPLLFETMIFNGPEDGYQERYYTWDEAKMGHKTAVELVKKHE